MQRLVQVRRLEPWDIAYFWRELRNLVRDMSMDGIDVTDSHIQHVATRLATGTSQAWIIGYNAQADGVILTSIETDTLYGYKYLHILGLKGLVSFTASTISRVAQALEAYAKMQGCRTIMARVEDPQLQTVLKRYGAKPVPIFYKEV